MKRFIRFALAAVLAVGLTACGTGTGAAIDSAKAVETIKPEETKAAETSEAPENVREQADDSSEPGEGCHMVKDHAGNEVMVPDEIDCIVIDQIPILSTYMSYFEGRAPYIAGFAGTFRETIEKTVLPQIAPELMEAEDTVYAQGDLNIEEIMRLEPDVIFYNANNREHYELLLKTGIPAVGFATVGEAATPADPLTRYKEWLRLLEEVFGEKGKMDEFIARGDEIVEDVRSRIAEIPESERPNGLVLFRINNGTPQVAGKAVFGDFWLKNLGVKNLAGETKGFAQVSLEQIYSWNPDILFLNGPGISPIRTQEVLDNSVEGVDFSSINAYKNRRVYNTTLGMWNWFTPNPDAPLVYAWLAVNTYPEQFKDYPLKETIKEYYMSSYGYELKDSEMEEMYLY